MNPTIEIGQDGRIRRLRSVLAGMKREHVTKVLTEFSLEDARSAGYIDSTDFDLVHDGKRYPPKAVLGLAAEQVIGRRIKSSEFSGGLDTPCFKILLSLGFDIEEKARIESLAVNRPIIQRFEFYDREQISQLFEPGVAFTRGAGRWGMPGIVETPKQSGSFVFMVTLGEPVDGNPYHDELTADGYLLWESQTKQGFESLTIQKFLVHDADERNIHLFVRSKKDAKYVYLGLLEYCSHDLNRTNPVHFVWRIRYWDLSPDKLSGLGLEVRAPFDPRYSPLSETTDAQTLVMEAPPPRLTMSNSSGERSSARASKPATVNWIDRDIRNRHLGLQGEKLVLKHEIELLQRAGREDLANRVRHVALYDATVGFDIESFRPDGTPKLIEVKTTQGPISTPFFISRNEVFASRKYSDSYVIYRVFNHSAEAAQVKFFELVGDVELSCGLVPINFQAYPGRGATA